MSSGKQPDSEAPRLDPPEVSRKIPPEQIQAQQEALVRQAVEPNQIFSPDAKSAQSTVGVAHYSASPLPDPKMLESYATILPDFPRFLMDAHRDEMLHRRSMELQITSAEADQLRAETEEIRSETRNRTRGLHYAFATGLIGIFAAIGLGFMGHEIAAGVVGGIPIIVGALLGKRRAHEPTTQLERGALGR